MKKCNFVIFVGLAVILLALFWVASKWIDPAKQSARPALAPPIIPEGFIPEPYPTPPSGRDLTASEAIERALYWDQYVVWDEPWSAKTFQDDSDRVTVELFPGEELGFSADIEGSSWIWIITIEGVANASNLMMHMPEEDLVKVVAYKISAQTGNLMGMHTERLEQ